MGLPRTVWVSIPRQNTDAGGLEDPEEPTSGTHAGEPTGTAHPPPPTTVDADAHGGATADRGPDAQTPPAASPRAADAAEKTPCPQATNQPKAENSGFRAPRGTGHTGARGQGTMCANNGPPAVLHEKRAAGATDDARPPQPAAAGARVRPGVAISRARAGTHNNPPPEDILASIFNAAAPTAGQGSQTHGHPFGDESLAAFMACCRDGAPNTDLTTTPALQRVSHDKEPSSPAQGPTFASH